MVEITDITGIGPSKADDLEDEGYESVEDIAQADPDNLSDISGISEDRALEYMVSAGDLLDDSEDDEESSGDEFDLTPDEVGEELQEDEEDDEDDEAEAEPEEEPEYTVTVEFDNRLQYHTFHAAIMRYHEDVYTSNQPYSDTMQKILDGLSGTESATYELTGTELNTLHTAVKQARTEYQGNNLIDHMDALNVVEGNINEQRREYLF